jgi:hypothetical protein
MFSPANGVFAILRKMRRTSFRLWKVPFPNVRDHGSCYQVEETLLLDEGLIRTRSFA